MGVMGEGKISRILYFFGSAGKGWLGEMELCGGGERERGKGQKNPFLSAG